MLGPNSKRTLKDSAHKGYDKTLVIPYRGFPFFDALHRNVWALQSLCPPPKMHFLQAVRKKMDKKSHIEKAKRVRDANNRAALYTCLVFIETEQINP